MAGEQQQRIHPVAADVEAGERLQPTAPLMTRGTERSWDKAGHPPPLRRTIPVAGPSRPPKRRRGGGGGCFRRCVCWSLCLALLLLVLLGIAAGVLYLIFKPKIPHYSVDRITIPNFTVDPNLTVTASFNVTVTATNPNRRVGIYYLGGSRLRVWFKDTELCQGSLPEFYQGHHNTTVLHLLMTGSTRIDARLRSQLQSAQSSGSVPIDFRGKVPVRLKLGALKLFKFRPLVRCHLLLNALSPNQPISIKRSDCNFKFRL